VVYYLQMRKGLGESLHRKVRLIRGKFLTTHRHLGRWRVEIYFLIKSQGATGGKEVRSWSGTRPYLLLRRGLLKNSESVTSKRSGGGAILYRRGRKPRGDIG